MRRRARTRLSAGGAALVAVVALAVAGCDADPDDPAAEDPVAELQLQPTRVTRVVGALPQRRREALARSARQLLERYLTAAFIESREGAEAFPGFTPGAAKLAASDRKLLTGEGFDGQQVVPRAGSALLSVLAPRGRPAGATASVELVMDVGEPGDTRRVKVRGRVLLGPSKDGWRIFGYDLSRSGWDAGRGGR